jgi:predicted RNase H-like nuclease
MVRSTGPGAPRRAVGIDGTRGGWVAVVVAGDRVTDVWHVTGLATVVERVGAVPIGVDIPIGLIDRPTRATDVAVRAQLAHTAASVFPAPCRSVVDAYRSGALADHDAATALSRRITGVGLSRQTWNLVDKVAEADALVEGGVDLREVHPELAFHLRAGRPLAGKRTWDGVMARLAILRELGVRLPDHVEGGDRVPPDDVFDAAIVAWTVAGLHRPSGLRCHPDPPAEWDRARPIAMWTRP